MIYPAFLLLRNRVEWDELCVVEIRLIPSDVSALRLPQLKTQRPAYSHPMIPRSESM